MKVMLDTNICIYVIKEQPPAVLEQFASRPVEDFGVSAITVAELEYGVTKSSRPSRNREALDQFLSPLEVAPFEREAAVVYGRLRTILERKGRPIGSMDLLIAAHAVSLDVQLITHNAKEFRRVPGLRLADWI